MLEEIIKTLIKDAESEWLEFKSFWYWNNSEIALSKGWGEFLKDFVALFNTNTENEKYLILGFDEKTKICQNYFTDKNEEKLELFNNLNDFKVKIVSKLRKSFKNIPQYRDSHDLISIETFFEIKQITIDDKQLLIFKIIHAPYFLELKAVLDGNESFREGNTLIRRLKNDASPENCNACHKEVQDLLNTAIQRQESSFPHKDASINKIVTLFQKKHAPSASINKLTEEHVHTIGIDYEIFSITGEYFPTIFFVYFTKYTSQNKTYTKIIETNILDNSSKIIVLTDELNKKKGRIDKKRIHDLFSSDFNNLSVSFLEEFALNELYVDLFDPDIFHQGSFNIKNFISPYCVESENKTADIILSEWYEAQNKPLIVLKGAGGIGKTTIVKYFLDNLYKKNNNNNTINILFINSHDIINEIMRNSKVEDIFDFYRIVAEKHNISKQFDKKLLEVSIDSGNLIIALDGLDEVISKMGSKFNLQSFIKAIFEDYSENLEKTKIIITCRDYFWDEQTINYPIETIALKPFNKVLAENYFKQNFKDDTGRIRKAMSLANEFALESRTYIPYILDMIVDNLLETTHSSVLDSAMLIPNILSHDYLVGKVCEREIFKLDNMTIDKQLEVLIYIALKYNGTIHEDQLSDLNHIFGEVSSYSFIEKFKAHPLLSYSALQKTIKFRYDFFNDYFKNIHLSAFLQKKDMNELDTEIIKIIIEYTSYDNSFTKYLKKRIFDIDKESLKESIWLFLEENINILNISDEKKVRLNSSLFILLLSIYEFNTIEDRTNMLREIYERGDKIIKNLCIVNLHAIHMDKLIFDFRELKFEDCHFENYEYFSECKFNSNTYISKSVFIAPLSRENVTPNISIKNIDSSSCDVSGIIELLETKEKKRKSKETNIRDSVKRVIKHFWSGSSFREKTADDTHKKLRDVSQILEKLLKQKVLIKTKKTTKQKRLNDIYYINPEYSNLRKIMEENETCKELETVVNLVDNSK
ncbi:NACHT domain-containing protein [Sulfurimonas sp.]|uniref:NACHT domain-containing protein n=1 Tax=Sulfurimonas sp. TaxID=2022749 RepID=UPI0035699CCE